MKNVSWDIPSPTLLSLLIPQSRSLCLLYEDHYPDPHILTFILQGCRSSQAVVLAALPSHLCWVWLQHATPLCSVHVVQNIPETKWTSYLGVSTLTPLLKLITLLGELTAPKPVTWVSNQLCHEATCGPSPSPLPTFHISLSHTKGNLNFWSFRKEQQEIKYWVCERGKKRVS